MKTLIALVLLLMLFPLCARADSLDCKEHTKLITYPGNVPENFHLKDNCARLTVNGDIYGTFEFGGRITISGTLEYIDTGENLGAVLYFRVNDPDKLPSLPHSGPIDKLRIEEFSRLKLPKLTKKEICWQSEATLSLRDFKYEISDQDDAGYYATISKMVRIGTFTKCTNR